MKLPFEFGSARRAVVSATAVAVVLAALAVPGSAAGRSAGVIDSFELVETVSLELPDGASALAAVAVDHRGRFLVADAGRHIVAFYGENGAFGGDFGGFGWEGGSLDGPTDLAVLAGFNIYVLDEGNRRVVRFDESGDYVGEMVSEGDAGTPVGIALGPGGALYVVDIDSGTVLVRSQFDEALTPFGRFGAGEGGLVGPSDVAVGPGLELAVVDRGRRSVPVFDQFGAELGAASAPDTLDPVAALFDRRGNLIVADAGRTRLIAYAPNGYEITAQFDMTKAASGFEPRSMAWGAGDEIVVLDGRGGRVARVRPVVSKRAEGQ